MSKERDKKYLVIGSAGHQFVHCIDWEVKQLPNLVDYDVIIINVQSITADYLKKISSERIDAFRKQLVRFLRSHGTLIVLADFYKFGENKSRYPERASNYFWSPIIVNIIREPGTTIELLEDVFPKYFSNFKVWEFYFQLSPDSLTSEIQESLGQPYEVNYKCSQRKYLQNREEQILAGAYHFWTENIERSKKIEVELGPIVMLPLLKNIDSKQALNFLLEDILKKPQESSAPLWIKDVKTSLIDDINQNITNNVQEIEKFQKKVDELQKQKIDLEYYKKLLYADGRELEEVFKKCLTELGALVNPAKYAQEEYCFKYDDLEYPVEAKGNTKSISLTDLRQLIDYLLTYDQETGNRNKGILLGNAWKNTSLDERDSAEKPVFPSNVIERAKATNIALVYSVDFLSVFYKFLEDKSLGKKILDRIVSSVGVVDFHDI